jgi:hypothetical protein
MKSKQSICNAHGIRVYPVPLYGSYFLEIEFNKSPDFDKRYILDVKRGSIRFEPKKMLWVEKIAELYEDLYMSKIEPKLKAMEKKKLKELEAKNELHKN